MLDGVRIGTSGWHYDHWIGPFYPEGTRKADLLAHYAESFGTVEINNTFYSLPKPKTLAGWAAETPDGFRFACKASRYITHMKKLKDPQASTERFFAAIGALGDQLGPVLFQLPPHWGANAERLEAFLAGLPAGNIYAFEFRDESWFAAPTLEALARHGAAFCIYDLGGRRAPLEVTAEFVYVRLHGPGGPYRGSYDDRALGAWAERILEWRGAAREVWCFFDNDENGYAAKDALRLIELVEAAAG